MIEKIKIAIYKLLKKSEKWTKTDMVYLAEGGFWLTLGQGVSSVSAFLLAIAFANLLPKETYGTYKYIMSIVSLLAIPTLTGMNTAIIQAVARGYEGSLISALKTKIKWGLLGGLLGLSLALYYYLQNNDTLAIAFLIVSVFIPFMDSILIYESYLNGKKNFKTLGRYTVFIRIISAITMVVTIFFTKNIYLIVSSYLLSNTLLRLILLKITLSKNKLNEKKDPNTISYGKHLSLMSILNIFSIYLDKLLIFHYLGASELAIYSIAIAPVEQMKGLIKNINALALPKFSATSTENLKTNLKPKILKMTLILAIMSFCYILIAPFAYRVFFPQYLESIFYSQLFSLSLVLIGPIMLLISAFQAKEKKMTLYQYNIIKPIIRIILLFVLINYFGITGIIFAILLSYVFELIFLSNKKISK
ncbi:hypothetical protein CVU82_01360 [Candidatus Falkowbacteria bacterium HGW-Falkowbacteria-1]|uniref:Polysaccharide biosynthesis protein C-terminal domain-containing protein n=1 Tax=Candidatus Falkowbacteria bacterium HGW-Falkowbacteria-1 TaxID=2013768 RepID=A0A2N2EAT1_9BACT|nr:MAG: hypothetical protein CVU82_01360 [Candidatus Falkowbacteria bacterium HGW-Falkowbacteria-1]